MPESSLQDATLTPSQRARLEKLSGGLQEPHLWQGSEPVALLERCWLRLDVVSIADLPGRLPPDASEAAPELVHYRLLLAQGLMPQEAERCCWDEFGEQACRAALRRYWQAQESGQHHGWTLERYLDLLRRYRAQFDAAAPRRLPLLVLARSGSREPHTLFWLPPPGRSMRHTCA